MSVTRAYWFAQAYFLVGWMVAGCLEHYHISPFLDAAVLIALLTAMALIADRLGMRPSGTCCGGCQTVVVVRVEEE